MGNGAPAGEVSSIGAGSSDSGETEEGLSKVDSSRL